ncbi:nucleotidyltransferase [Methylophilales bacterium]|nr:nucleotidyltransferase [Methylophilales bacterium]
MKGKTIYFGAAGSGRAYCQHTKTYPDFFIDNDSSKWGTFIEGIEIKQPSVLESTMIEKIIITSGYVKEMLPQLLSMGIDRDKIHSPAKSLLGFHIFKDQINRIQTAKKLFQIMSELRENCKIVAVGGTALGFARNKDFILWDSDIDLFAPIRSKLEVFEFLKNLGYKPEYELHSIKATMILDNGVEVPIGIDLLDWGTDTFVDIFEDYSWVWPTKMFTECSEIEVHGVKLNIPNPVDKYLRKIYGETWQTPNPNFAYSDYGGEKA